MPVSRSKCTLLANEWIVASDTREKFHTIGAKIREINFCNMIVRHNKDDTKSCFYARCHDIKASIYRYNALNSKQYDLAFSSLKINFKSL
jgi:hypothetical protein